MALVKLRDLALGYAGEVVVKGLNAEILAGDFVCIVGANGSGKTTLIKGILGLISPISGEVIFEDLEPRFVGYMPQEMIIPANFPATVFEVVLSGALNQMRGKAFYGRAEREKAMEKLKLLKILDLKNESFAELSGGERQKVLLARSLMATTKLLILDEPSNNLDKRAKADFYRVLEQLNREGITILMITHDLDHDNLIGNKILSLRDEIFYGTTDEFVRRIHNE